MIAYLRKIFSRFRNKIKKTCFFLYRHAGGAKQIDLLIYDDIYPHPISGFRYEEITVLLKEFQNSRIILDPRSYPKLNSPRKLHQEHLATTLKLHPGLEGKVVSHHHRYQPLLFYCVFLSNIFRNLSWLEERKIPFIFTLYPGGGFVVDDPKTDEKMSRVLGSPMFRKVIVTQKYTRDYIIDRSFCAKENVEFIFGCVVPQKTLNSRVEKKRYAQDKKTFDVVFCAAKYTPKGQDKGYDVFIEFAHSISKKYDFVNFHVIGGFDEEVLDISSIKDRIHFYGFLNFEDLQSVFNFTDVIVSPNKPFKLRTGAFDGFPLGTVVEAVFNGAVALVSDELKQNTVFEHNKEIIIIKPDSDNIEKEIVDLINQPKRLYSISENGRKKFKEIYSNNIQMLPRIKLLRSEISKTI